MFDRVLWLELPCCTCSRVTHATEGEFVPFERDLPLLSVRNTKALWRKWEPSFPQAYSMQEEEIAHWCWDQGTGLPKWPAPLDWFFGCNTGTGTPWCICSVSRSHQLTPLGSTRYVPKTITCSRFFSRLNTIIIIFFPGLQISQKVRGCLQRKAKCLCIP